MLLGKSAKLRNPAKRGAIKCAAILLLPIALAACAGNDDGRIFGFIDNRGAANQPYPSNYRAELLAFMKTYLNDPVAVHDATMALPPAPPGSASYVRSERPVAAGG